MTAAHHGDNLSRPDGRGVLTTTAETNINQGEEGFL